MQNIKLMTLEEINREVDAFNDFTRTCGMGYLNEKGLQRFNQLKGEAIARLQQQQPDHKLAQWNDMSKQA